MRLTAILLFSALLPAGSATADTAAPIFGGSATGAFQVADQQTGKLVALKRTVHSAGECAGPDCTGSIKPANLPVSGNKP